MREKPEIGDIVHIKSDAPSIFANSDGAVLRVRTRQDGYWTAAEIDVNNQRRWFNKGDIDYIVRRRGSPGAPKGDFVRIERRPNKRRSDIALHIYIGRALLARWRDVAGNIGRVKIQIVNGQLMLRADEQGPFALDDTPGRMPRIHCDSARNLVILEDGRYATRMQGKSVIVTDLLPE